VVLAIQLFQIDDTRTVALTDHQLRHTHVRIGVQPEAKPGRGLRQAGCKVDLAISERFFKLRLI
jgi:hypothetical protein